MFKKLFSLIALSIGVSSVATAQIDTTALRAQTDSITAYLREMNGPSLGYIGRVRVDSIRTTASSATIYYAPTMAQYALRKASCDHVYEILRAAAPQAEIKAVSEGREIHDLVPKFYTQTSKKKKAPKNPVSLVTPLDRPYTPTEGLVGRHIALWQSHGYYYEQKLLR